MNLTKIVRIATITVAVSAAMALSGCSTISGVVNAVNNGTDVTKPGVFSMKVGNCFSEPPATADNLVGDLEFVDCAVAHDNEAFAETMMADESFPGDDATLEQAEAACAPAFYAFIGADESYEGSLDYNYYVPTAESWAEDDRAISCIVYDAAGQSTGTLAGAAQ